MFIYVTELTIRTERIHTQLSHLLEATSKENTHTCACIHTLYYIYYDR